MAEFAETEQMDMWQVGSMFGMPPWYSMPQIWPQQQQQQRGKTSKRSPFKPGTANGLTPKKQRFCATFPNIVRCRHGVGCAFAHSREEVTAPLLTEEEESCAETALTDEFFTSRFKTLWCPIGAQHDWHSCAYAHTYQDVRRPPAIGYGHQLCPYWNKKDTSLTYGERCPWGPRCPYAHGAKEQLYHPRYFRTLVCRDLQRRKCPRADLCAFFHKASDARKVIPKDPVDYSQPLPKDALPAEWLLYFMSPPRFQDAGMGDEAVLPPRALAAVTAAMAAAQAVAAASVCDTLEEDGGTTTEDGPMEESEESEWPAEDLGPAALSLEGMDEGMAEWVAAAALANEMAWGQRPYYSPFAAADLFPEGFPDDDTPAYV
mmetsp:Transcript_111430/g.320121  ORF Transcript_111430/g.320121 Transcript_111430/m.320121 type:complete len:374 (+) Transcript_111430:53-1174(+)